MSKNILITGGCGFVGRHLVARLASEAGNSIWVVDNLSTGKHPRDWEVPALSLISESGGVATYTVEGSDKVIKCIIADFAALAQAELGIVPSLGIGKLPHFDEAYH